MNHEQAIASLAPERYLLGEMTELEKHEFEEHYFDCAECADDVRAGDLMREHSGSGALSQGVVAMPQRAQSSVVQQNPVGRQASGIRQVLPWAVAAGLALVASYQSFVAVPALRDAMAPQALAPIALRPASRGAAPEVSVVAGQPFLLVSADVQVQPGTAALWYELLGPARTAVISSRAALPSPGAPLLLLLPVDALPEAGQYTLLVRDTDASGAVLGEYSFVASF